MYKPQLKNIEASYSVPLSIHIQRNYVNKPTCIHYLDGYMLKLEFGWCPSGDGKLLQKNRMPGMGKKD